MVVDTVAPTTAMEVVLHLAEHPVVALQAEHRVVATRSTEMDATMTQADDFAAIHIHNFLYNFLDVN